jgi:hypothetical protein
MSSRMDGKCDAEVRMRCGLHIQSISVIPILCLRILFILSRPLKFEIQDLS